MRTTNQILNDAEEILRTARVGLSDFLQLGPRKMPGLLNLVAFGRAVTNVLQNLRSTEPQFDDWYTSFRSEMQQDQLMKYFYNLRSRILKEGSVPQMQLRGNFSIGPGSLPPAPPGAIETIVGDFKEGGSSYFVVRLPDGQMEKYYFSVPREVMSVDYYLPEGPTEHLGQNISGRSVEELAKLFLDYLTRLVDSAKREFFR